MNKKVKKMKEENNKIECELEKYHIDPVQWENATEEDIKEQIKKV